MESWNLTAEHLSVGYEKKSILEDVNFSVCGGEILVLIGPNGAGKSTILKSITGQIPLLGGGVYLGGLSSDLVRSITDRRQILAQIDAQDRGSGRVSLSDLKEKELARIMALMMTAHVTPEYASSYDIVANGRYPYTGQLGLLSQDDHRAIEEAMDLVHVAELADKMFGTLSDGQKQRVLLARAICQEPKILVLDEPTGFLDIKHKLEFLQALRGLVREKKIAVIMSLHELELAGKIADHVLCVDPHGAHVESDPKKVFTSCYLESLFDMKPGSLQIDRIGE